MQCKLFELEKKTMKEETDEDDEEEEDDERVTETDEDVESARLAVGSVFKVELSRPRIM